MKSFLVLATLVISSQAMSAEVLLKLTRGSGFTPVPTKKEITITDNGQMTVIKTVKGTSTKLNIGKLTADAVQSLKDKIETIADDAVLVDLDANRPRCMDAPSSSISVIKGGKEIKIAARSLCHNFEVKDLEAASLVKLIESVGYLSK